LDSSRSWTSPVCSPMRRPDRRERRSLQVEGAHATASLARPKAINEAVALALPRWGRTPPCVSTTSAKVRSRVGECGPSSRRGWVSHSRVELSDVGQQQRHRSGRYQFRSHSGLLQFNGTASISLMLTSLRRSPRTNISADAYMTSAVGRIFSVQEVEICPPPQPSGALVATSAPR